ncbi:sulfite oxidase-like oxidoreductase [Fimbriimonas ginsengisoli]|uniref:Oxidoreductase molybdopterin binding protein n=1 Tax=Fimbriimonas ginsengisoli Gsoil 348 TaxID=661478 RepID=A0A068NYE9_FIMGI|nr:sulfite oxidase-like oxidoreductase [Fimbriimonas ginsengisoli]AIE88060.1 oxidoreductase molybdopterin binding protein [Fimbriimonas ginsengisoli Gsoil 348]
MLPKRTIKRVVPGSDRAEEEAKYQPGDPPGPESAPPGAIISSDTRRENRIPPGQARTRKWPVLDAFGSPEIDLDEWELKIGGLVKEPKTLDLEAFQALPRAKVFADMHCVTRWSRLGNLWEGVPTSALKELVEIDAKATHVLAFGYDEGWTTNVPIEEFFAEDVLLADLHDGRPIPLDHGGPVRLVVPRLYAWKSAKWIHAIEFLSGDQAGFWEKGGYHMHGDPWNEERFGSRWW